MSAFFQKAGKEEVANDQLHMELRAMFWGKFIYGSSMSFKSAGVTGG